MKTIVEFEEKQYNLESLTVEEIKDILFRLKKSKDEFGVQLLESKLNSLKKSYTTPRACQWCFSQMEIFKEEPPIDVGFAFPYDRLRCPKCKAIGPLIQWGR